MEDMTMTDRIATPESEEFITLIGASMDEIHLAFREQGLAERQFSILHRVGRHRFQRCSGAGAEPLFDGETLVAATFRRQRPA
jgi:hypothetical protein